MKNKINSEKDMKNWMKKIEKLKSEDKVDLSSDEDLSIALMNLIAIEEHLYFSGIKTEKKAYFNLLNPVREMRKKLLKEIVGDSEGEVWCLSKHLLACSMRLIEVGNKHLTKKEDDKAHDKFQDAFYLYSLFWSLNLNLLEKDKLDVKGDDDGRSKISSFIKRIIDCCNE